MPLYAPAAFDFNVFDSVVFQGLITPTAFGTFDPNVFDVPAVFQGPSIVTVSFTGSLTPAGSSLAKTRLFNAQWAKAANVSTTWTLDIPPSDINTP